MKIVLAVVVVLSIAACAVLGYLISQRKPMSPAALAGDLAGKDVPEDLIDQLAKVDPRHMIGKEAARLPTGLKELRGIAVGPQNRIYAVGDQALVVLNAEGALVRRVELPEAPRCVGVDAEGAAYVGHRARVQVVDPSGVPKEPWPPLSPSSWITSIGVSGDRVYVGDFGRKFVAIFDRAGAPVGEIRPSEPGKKDAKFVIPSPFFDVALDPSGRPWVTHTGKRLLEAYGPDGTVGQSWGKSSPAIEGFSGCCNPTHIAIRKDGTFVTSEKGLVRVKIHRPTGELVGVLAAAKDFSRGLTGLDVAVDGNDRILVADPAGRSIRVYTVPPAH
ncbi:MAG TPA: hypothetical protein VEJ18_15240 [Planctomycetota bacterium]|nr:hypothetical protein [Planctomycetota bacterium]